MHVPTTQSTLHVPTTQSTLCLFLCITAMCISTSTGSSEADEITELRKQLEEARLKLEQLEQVQPEAGADDSEHNFFDFPGGAAGAWVVLYFGTTLVVFMCALIVGLAARCGRPICGIHARHSLARSALIMVGAGS